MVFLRDSGSSKWELLYGLPWEIPSVANVFQNNTAVYDQHDTQIYFSVTGNEFTPLNACLQLLM